MNRGLGNRRVSWQSNPSLIWLSFGLPLVLGAWGVVSGALLLILLLVRGRPLYSSWSARMFLPVLILLLSIGVAYLWCPDYVTEWTLAVLSLSAGWLWQVEYILSDESPIGLDEWLFSARLYGLGGLLFLLLYSVMPRGVEWLAPVLIVAGIVVHGIRMGKRRERVALCCPLTSGLVRLAVVRGADLWLTKAPYSGCYVAPDGYQCHTPRYLDHPLTSCVGESETPEEALTRALVGARVSGEALPRFMLKYQHSTCDGVSRDIYLFVLNIKSDETMESKRMKGRFCTKDEVERGLESGLFGPLFIDEYNYLKNTLFRANTLEG